MSRFEVETDKLKITAGDMKRTCDSVENINKATRSIVAGLAMQAECAGEIKARLSQINQQLMEEAVKIDTLSGALQRLAELYEKTEREIMGNQSGTKNGGMEIASEAEKESNWITKIRDWLKDHGLWFWGWWEKKKSNVTLQQEQQQDRYMQEQIENLNDKSRYSQETWKKASVKERKKILNEYIKEVAAIMGLSISEIDFFYAESKGGYVTMGQYDDWDDSVHINEWVLEEGDKNGFASYSIFTTVVHEMRHAYQHAACNDPSKFKVSQETIDSWQESFDKYKSKAGFMATGMSETEAYRAYRNQAVEVDARKFAKQS